MLASQLDFELPPHLIAQQPSPGRAQSRLMRYSRSTGAVEHLHFSDLPTLLCPTDLLVLNNSKVIPARFTLQKPATGGLIEGLFLEEEEPGLWHVLLKNLGHYHGALRFLDQHDLTAHPVDKLDEGYLLRVDSTQSAPDILQTVGRMPLPPYIRRDKTHDPLDPLDRERYQTCYAQPAGSIAAPTAGLHFTPELFQQLDQKGIAKVFVTLHVGMGTFKPIQVDNLDEHVMHVESYAIPQPTADAINLAHRQKRRVIAVGTTSCRVLESQPDVLEGCSGQTDIFIKPGYVFKHVDALVTNFHLPKSTLIALVAALVGLEEQKRLYAIAIEKNYRFFSYGDALLIER